MSKPLPAVRKDSDPLREKMPRRMSPDEANRWREENAEAIRSINEWVEKNGLPLDPYRVS